MRNSKNSTKKPSGSFSRRDIFALCGGTAMMMAAIHPATPFIGLAKAQQESTSSNKAMEDLIAGAQKEGTVTFYASPINPRIVSDAFTKKYGIRVDLLRIGSSELNPRFAAEAAAKSVAADVIVTPNDVNFWNDMYKEGHLVNLGEAGVPSYKTYPADFLRNDVKAPIAQIVPFVIAYNKDEVSASTAPTTWQDFIDPKWKGKIALGDPKANTTYAATIVELADKFGEEYVRALGRQKPLYYSSSLPLIQAVASGEVSLAYPPNGINVELSVKQGAPLGVVKMRADQESWGGEQLLGVSRNAPHPSAARLFAEFILSKEGNAIVNGDADNWGVVASGGLPIGHEHYIPIKAASSSKERVNRIIALLGL